MNKQELIAIVAEENELSKAQAGRIVDSVFEAIVKAVAKGDTYNVYDLAVSLKVRSRPRSALLAKVAILPRAKRSRSRPPCCRSSPLAPLSRLLLLLRRSAASANQRLAILKKNRSFSSGFSYPLKSSENFPVTELF